MTVVFRTPDVSSKEEETITPTEDLTFGDFLLHPIDSIKSVSAETWNEVKEFVGGTWGGFMEIVPALSIIVATIGILMMMMGLPELGKKIVSITLVVFLLLEIINFGIMSMGTQ